MPQIEFTPWTLENFSRVDFMTDEFNRMLYQKGARITWEKSSLCSCIDIHSGQPDFSCPSCYGRGYSYFDPKDIRAMVSSLNGDKNQAPIGLIDVGTCYLTTMPQDEVGFRDRIIFNDFKTPYSQVLEYSSQGIPLRFKAIELTSLRVLNNEIPRGLVGIDEDMQTLYIDESYGLQEGERFSVLYKIKPTYIVIDIPHELRGTWVKFGQPNEEWRIMPRQFLLKREDLLPLKRGEML